MPDRRKRAGGRAAKKAERTSSVIKGIPYITRKVPFYEVLNEEGLTLIENNAETILQEIGVEFRGDQEALDLWNNAGADLMVSVYEYQRDYAKNLFRTVHLQNLFNTHVIRKEAYGLEVNILF